MSNRFLNYTTLDYYSLDTTQHSLYRYSIKLIAIDYKWINFANSIAEIDEYIRLDCVEELIPELVNILDNKSELIGLHKTRKVSVTEV